MVNYITLCIKGDNESKTDYFDVMIPHPNGQKFLEQRFFKPHAKKIEAM